MVNFLALLRLYFKKYFCNFRLFETKFPKQCDCTLETDDQNSLFPTDPQGKPSTWIQILDFFCQFLVLFL